MIKNTNLAIALSSAISLVSGILLLALLGTDSVIIVVVEIVIVLIVFFVCYGVFALTTSEKANLITRERRQTMISETKYFLGNIRRTASKCSLGELAAEITEIADSIFGKIAQPGRFEESTLVDLHSYLSDINKIVEYVFKVETGELSVRDQKLEISNFQAKLEEYLQGFRELKISLDANDVAAAQATARALQIKMDLGGISDRTSVIDDIQKQRRK